MKALDKIWINTDSLNGYYMSSHPLSGEEYIRKDALLEWARENHKRMVEVHSDYTKIYDEYFRGLIEKLESL